VIRPSRNLAAVGLWLASSAVACAPRSGPLDQSSGPGEVCVPAGQDRVVTIGIDVLRNSGQAPALIEGIALAEPSAGLTIVGAVVVPVGFELVGVREGFPPAVTDLDHGVIWEQRVEVSKAEIPPETISGSVWNLVVGVGLTDGVESGHAAGFRLFYAVGNRSYQYVTAQEIELRSGTCLDDEL